MLTLVQTTRRVGRLTRVILLVLLHKHHIPEIGFSEAKSSQFYDADTRRTRMSTSYGTQEVVQKALLLRLVFDTLI
jgi:hypothetical protein